MCDTPTYASDVGVIVVQDKEEKNVKDPMEILEEALVICKFGRFHIQLLAASFCTIFAFMIVTTTSSYIVPNAECDLNMNIMQKGLLNAMPFFGQVGASLFTGVLIDMFGRRLFLVGGNAALFILCILEGSSQSYWMLVTIKFFQGIPLSLCWSAITPMLTELISKEVRDRVLLLNTSFISLSLIIAPLLSWAMLPHQYNIVIWKGYFELHSWNIYLYVCSIWSFMATLLYYFLPESPKYLISHGQENEALEVLKTIYQRNTGNRRDQFPITSLNQTEGYSETTEKNFNEQLRNSTQNVKELFRRPLLFRLILVTFIMFVCLLSYSSLRLWYPQLSTIIENYHKEYDESAQFCVMINSYKSDLGNVVENITEPAVCIPKLSGSETYINGILMGFIFFGFVIISACLIDRLGQKILMWTTLILCCICSSSLYWANSSIQIALLISSACALMQTFLSLLQNVFVRIFPTTVRALAMSINIMLGRIGSLSGVILFPFLLEIGCVAPFLALSIVCICVAFLIYFIPDPNKSQSGAGDK